MSDSTTVDAGGGGSADTPSARAYLLVREGGQTQVVNLDEGADVLFGRSQEATVRLEDHRASREHLRIRRRQGELRLIDLGGRNGTRLNEELVRGESRGLRSGDLVRVGEVEIIVAETTPSERGRRETRLQGALERVRKEHAGHAALLRLPIDTAELATVSSALGACALIEAQPDGDYACVPDDPRRAERVVQALLGLTPPVVAGLARAPADGDDAETLWAVARSSRGAETSPPATAARPSATVRGAPPGVVIADPAMVQVYELVRKVAPAPTTVLVLGETGSGKEVVAEQIHLQSPRAKGPFIRLNCGSLPETLLESELFGHERGAFTGAERRKEGYLEAADGGTLFLDEIGELTLAMQTRLLRVLETHRFMRVGGREEIASDLRVIAATNRDLAAEVKAGRFREDLYFRLSTFIIRLPPLRQRPAEIALLAELFVRDLSRKLGTTPRRLTRAAMAQLQRHSWPGNVRELRNALERAVVLADEGEILPSHLPEGMGEAPAPEGAMREQLADLERRSIQAALDAEGGVQTRAAKRLGISRRALQYKLEKLRIR